MFWPEVKLCCRPLVYVIAPLDHLARKRCVVITILRQIPPDLFILFVPAFIWKNSFLL